MRTLLRWTLWGGLLLGACNGDDDDSPPGRGSAACQDFQDAACDFTVDRCKRSDRASCDHAFKGIECKSDAAASACANGLNVATCGGPVSGCNINEVIDPAPAVARCEELFDKVCAHFISCGQFPDRITCVAAITTTLSCATAVSVSLDYEDCIDSIDDLTCSARGLPPVCNAAISVLPPGVIIGM